VGAAHQDTVAAMQAFVDRHDLGSIPHAVDQAGELWQHFGVVSQPNWLFVDAAGAASFHRGALSEGQLDERIGALLAG
jgi:hypothetical protein